MVSYLQVENLSKSFGDLVLFDNLSLGVGDRDRIGLIARNGAGKTTLLNIIVGKEDYSNGAVVFRRDIKVAYLSQDPQFEAGMTVIEACFSSDSPTVRAIAAYEKAISGGDQSALHNAMELMDQLDAWSYENRAKQILSQLKITHFDQPVEQLSGGQVKRVALANALIVEPDLLILDEPTNHLDLEMTTWLEEYLTQTKLALLMVTHDRYFLDRVCTSIIEIDDYQTYSYAGNYTQYLEKRQERLDSAAAQREGDKNRYRKELDWMRRQPQARATKARARIESFYELEERLRREREAGKMQLDVKATYIGKKIFEAKNICKKYGDQVITDRFNYMFARYEKMGIIGENGAGKSTFIKMLLGEVEPDSGVFDVGETVRFGYYSQDGISFKDDAKVIDVITDIAENIELSDGRKMTASQFLNYFLFPPKTQHNFVGKLSGGEKRRLYLCTILMQNPNFLVLDEPTNDLDIMTLNVLEEYLSGFSGCLIVVSHDRYFMDKVVDHILVFQGGGVIKDFPSSYSDYIEWKRLKDAEVEIEHSLHGSKLQSAKSQPAVMRSDAKSRRLSFNERREMEQLEKEIPLLEAQKEDLESEMSSGELSIELLTEKSNKVSALIKLIDSLSMRWLELSEIDR